MSLVFINVSRTNHYPQQAPTQAAIYQSLVDAETRDLAAGNDFTLDADISPTTLIALGWDLEAEQYVYLS